MRKTIIAIGVIAIMAVVFLFAPFKALSENTVPYTPDTMSNISGSNSKAGNTGINDINSTGNSYDKLSESIILYVGSPLAYVSNVQTQIDPANEEITPVIIDNVEMVPVRFIAESLGGNVNWDQRTLTATIVLEGKSYKFTQGSDTMRADGKKYSLGAAVVAYKERTFVPLDTFVEILGKKAFYERGLIIISDEKDIFDPVKDRELISEWISKLSFLPRVGSYEKLVSLLEEGLGRGSLTGFYDGRKEGLFKSDNSIATDDIAVSFETEMSTPTIEGAAASDSTADAQAKTAARNGADSAESADYSTTNVQVQGVDEGDIVKTDGDYIYHVNRERVVITKVDMPEDMKVISSLEFTQKNLSPQELYLHDQRLIVIGSSRASFPIRIMEDGVQKEIYPAPQSIRGSVKVLVYDMSDKKSLKLLREVEIEGSYVSSRKVDTALYLVANNRLNYNRIQRNEMNITPSYRDTALKEDYINIGYESIRYFPSARYDNYMIVAGIDVTGNEPADVSTYLGAGQNVYASTENLYTAVSGYSSALAGKTSEKTFRREGTQIYKFAMKDAKVTYLCKGEVPGTILNQFSMDENRDYFRIATTTGDTWATDERISKNCLYVLDSMLSITGRIEDMAPGEKIYSVRFMGDRAYVVTFKTVDPLFVIDLKNPDKPAVLGALKIPGYSDYLHPYDENHLIGFGKDTTEIKGQAYYLGMKVALFDVSDVSNPIQKFSEIIGDRGTDSDLLQNHKALLFSKEKNLLAFPVTLMEIKDGSEKAKQDSLQYGQFTFQGALVYNLDLENGFRLKGRITHLSEEDYLKAGNSWYNSDKNVQRIIYIDDNLFTLSNEMIKANAIADLKEKGSVIID